MKPQQKKADELVWKFMDKVDVYPMEVRKQSAIQCAIICVEEIMKANPIVPLEYMLESESLDKAREYWQSVLNELKSRL
jgi:hypothetical protein